MFSRCILNPSFLPASTRELSKSSDFEFIIKVYHTGSDKAHTPLSKEALTIDKESMLPNMPSETGSVMSDIEMDDTNKKPPENQPSDSIEHGQVDDGKTNKKGFDTMELARVVQARESVIWHNVPVFIALSASIWIGCYIIFEWYNYCEFKYNKRLFGRVWGTLICWLFSISFALVVEGAVLHLRMHWFAPIKDAYNIGECIDDLVKEVETSAAVSTLILSISWDVPLRKIS